MGIGKIAKSILAECKRRPFEGSVLALGRQDILFDYSTLESWALHRGVVLIKPASISLSNKEELAELGFISDETFFCALGFSEVETLDYSDFEGANYLFDLNSYPVPDELRSRFDVIIDGGTTEHVFHLPNALANICDMLKENGRIFHAAPSSNHMDHGFYMFSPTLFLDYYVANKFRINTFHLFKYTLNLGEDLWEFSQYTPGALAGISMGGLDDGMYGIWVVATKTDESTHDVVPQQGLYEALWKGSAGPVSAQRPLAITRDEAQPVLVGRPRWPTCAKNMIKRWPVLHNVLRSLKHKLTIPGVCSQKEVTNSPRKKGLGLEIIDRY